MSVNFEAKLEDGTLVAKADGVEFTVGDGNCVTFDFDGEKMLLSDIGFNFYVNLKLSVPYNRLLLPCSRQGCKNHEER